MTSKTAEGVTSSYNSFGCSSKANINSRKCHSAPFLKPVMGLQRLTSMKNHALKKVCKILSQAMDSKNSKADDFSLDESKLIIRVLAAQLERIVQNRKAFFLSAVIKDGSCMEEQQEFILQWAEDVMLTQNQETAGGGMSTTTDHFLMEEVREPEPQSTDKEQRLKRARRVLFDWAWSLTETQEGSVCLGEEMSAVVRDLGKQWKKGTLANILPVMDFIIWSLLQQHTQEGSAAKQWHRNQRRFRSRAPTHTLESVWTWILKATADITLDSSTKNPSLQLSQDRKGVKMKQIIESINNPWDGFSRSQSAYDSWWCVLGSEGYDSGRHYWEVDISGKTEWRIGVVKESAPRNGFVTLDTAAGYWTLRLQLGRLLAMTTPVTKLNSCAPRRLGVFLDMEEGLVSFYDAQHRRHIYTFDVTFDPAERIYPVFGTVETDRELHIVNN
ncbi:E3 ubiquitin-protein ligase TRIM68 isoform X2 [Myripristis murdjan]|uniref:E3 ubiquitin-protein ligase TRIM68 isoform X2 n=1 Tax=Myripristis murdjan TaxID=586833 RepID=UPI0011764284|nr:E3 ubiquitin-protein ligase TRIM68-like isoform X2 [Myripristis murdjan]